MKALLEGGKLEGTWFERTAYYRVNRRRKVGDPPIREHDFKTAEELDLSPLPCMANLRNDHHRDYLEGLIEKIVAAAAAAGKAVGTMVLGASRLQTQNPHTQPIA